MSYSLEDRVRDEEFARQELETRLQRADDRLAQERRDRRAGIAELRDAIADQPFENQELAAKVNALVILLTGKAFTADQWQDALSKWRRD